MAPPDQSCNYCHGVNIIAERLDKYTKVVARRMLQMVADINQDWKSHVQNIGVTCYTCHRGQPVPANIWFEAPAPNHALGMAQMAAGKNHPSVVANGSSLPDDPFTPFLLGDNNIRVQGTEALPYGNLTSIKQADWTWSLMMHFSESLGVNCTYCHNSRAWSDWSQSSPQRVTAWYGIRMVREQNINYLQPLTSVFPHARLGVLADAPKVNCATCHQGAYKPLYGVSMLKDYPELGDGTIEPAVTQPQASVEPLPGPRAVQSANAAP